MEAAAGDDAREACRDYASERLRQRRSPAVPAPPPPSSPSARPRTSPPRRAPSPPPRSPLDSRSGSPAGARGACRSPGSQARSNPARALPRRHSAPPPPLIATPCPTNPHPPQELERALDALVGPEDGVGRGIRLHHVEARRVGAVALDHVLRVDAVALRLGHRADAVVVHRAAVALELRARDAPLGVAHGLHRIGRAVLDPALVAAAR